MIKEGGEGGRQGVISVAGWRKRKGGKDRWRKEMEVRERRVGWVMKGRGKAVGEVEGGRR